MKKFFCLLFVAVMICSASCVLAEEPDLSAVEITEKTEIAIPEINLKNSSFARNPKADKVTNNNSVYTVSAAEASYVLDMTKYPKFLCFTQDREASFASYLMWGDPDGLLNSMIDDGMHFFIVDPETYMRILIYTWKPDQLSQFVGNFSNLSETNQQVVAIRMGAESVLKCGDNVWMVHKDQEDGRYVTVFNDHYIVVEYGGSGSVDDDMSDTGALLSGLKLVNP